MRFSTLLICVSCILAASAERSAMAVDVLARAIAGQPYGVATIEIPLAIPIVGQTPPPIQVTDAAATTGSGRVFYSFSEDVKVSVPPPSETPVPRPGNGRLLGRLGNLIREIANPEADQEQTVARRVTFLFVGSDPLTIRVSDAVGEIGTYPIAVEPNSAAMNPRMDQWWQGYVAAAKSQIDAADYPTWIEDYLIAMLSRRIGMPLPSWFTDTQRKDDEVLDTLKLIAGVPGASEAIFRRSAVGSLDPSGRPADDASLPLPPPPRWAPMFDDPSLVGVPVEPMATRVPPECFYIRYGSFENYAWFADLSTQYGGDISSMVMLRGIEMDTTERIQNQLNLEMTELSRMLAPNVIEDQAVIGRDLFLSEGTSLGVLFKAKNGFLLNTSLGGDRSKLARDDDEVSLKDVTVGGQTVSLLSTADNRVRSFMVRDGDYFLITNSRKLVERFLEVGVSGQSLAATPAFQLARQLMPTERNDSLFVYFSPEMLRGLVSPSYLIELRRRLAASADIAMLHMARAAAEQESLVTGRSMIGVDPLIVDGFLPAGFGVRPDGSGTVIVGDHVMDTQRGSRGHFLPIADVTVDLVTADEAAWYGDIARQYETKFPTIDPIMVGIQREPIGGVNGGGEPGERITIHAEVAPLVPEKYGKWAGYLGPPTRVSMKFAPDDIVAVQAHVASDQLGPPTHLFAAIKDTVPPQPEDFDGLLNTFRSLRGIPGYLGAWPQPGMLDRLPLGIGRGQPVGPGMNRLIGGLYRYADGQFSVLSFQPAVLESTLPFLGAVDVDDPAQVRASVGNLRGSQIEGWVNGQLYDHAREGSVAGASLLSLVTRQLGVAPEIAEQQIEKILGVPLQCTLGGQYEYSPASQRWFSTAWRGPVAPMIVPPDYVPPPMTWFRGAQATVTQYADRLVADAVIDVAR
ncbi:hypothetical protein Poly51_15790 [Rubripirellula tenax]|uniref:Uncharacterized protein n=1 Tax=Rubripirellula tenax TaxID=2528015 RepID=A0A5C6FGK2_9BACT|nr:hypothetical protein [Rubripirellula tenax]TWU58799.1 hypothetical protein Poly51_15790 [Rubripirellula tenax]